MLFRRTPAPLHGFPLFPRSRKRPSPRGQAPRNPAPWKLVLALALFLSPVRGLAADPEDTADPVCRVPVSTYRIPESVTFCGEPVPLQWADVRERLEREFYYHLDREGQLLLYIKRAGRTDPVVQPILASEGLPLDLKYLPVAESGLLFRSQSPVGAVGYWQFMKGTAERYGLRVDRYVDDRRSLSRSTRAAAAYLKDLHDTFGSWATALAAYNWGEHNVVQAVESQGSKDYYDLYLPEETDRFVFRIITLKLIMDNPAAYDIHVTDQERYRPPPTKNVTLTARQGIPISVLAECADTSPRSLRHMNDWMLQNVLPAGIYTFKVPKGKEKGLDRCVATRLAERKQVVHVVAKGESLGRIAEQYGVPVQDIERWNEISRRRPIHPGQQLVIRSGD